MPCSARPRGYGRCEATHGSYRITGVVLLMAFLHITPQVFIMLPYYRATRSFTSQQLLHALVPYNVLIAYMYLTYYLCVTSDAGGVPYGWSPDEAMAEHGVELTAEHRRFCHKCDAFKPPRAHHCKQCKRCVLRMDHHCPWIGNCVGIHNHAPFMRFLVAVSVAGAYLLSMISLRVGDWWNTDWYLSPPSNSETVMIVLNYILGTPPVALTSLMMWYQWYLLSINTTTIETHEQDRVTRQIRRGQIPFFEYPFDVGVWRNMTDVMGPNILLWLWPFSQTEHDGLLYPVSQPYPEAQFLWPPYDRRAKQRRRRPLPESAFTYGEEQLNPDLHPSNAAVELGRRTQYAVNGSIGVDEDESDDYEDDTQQHSRVRIRRGSEGVEIRPPQYSRMLYEMQQEYSHLHPDAFADDTSEPTGPDADELPTDTPAPKIVNIQADDAAEADEGIPLGHLVRRHLVSNPHGLEEMHTT